VPGDDVLLRGRRTLALDLKRPGAADAVLRVVESADVLIEGNRPGVAERLGLGPDACFARNPHLVYGRMTGWGQDGPLASAPGHDLNYIALTGALHAIGGERPVVPLNLVGDFGGGGMLLAVGVLAALLSGEGQVVDAAMTDGAALLMTLMYGLRAGGAWRDERGTNVLDGGAPFYDVYETADGGWMSVGCLEPQFFVELLRRVGLEDVDAASQMDRSRWPALRERLAAVFRTRTRDEWERAFDGAEVCAAPVLSMAEAPRHPHNAARGTFVDVGGVEQPAPAPRFSRTPAGVPSPVVEDGAAVLRECGFGEDEIAALLE
jgi:alpha-methylacyl-CoA racemase